MKNQHKPTIFCAKRPENVENVEDVCPASELLLEPIASWHETAWGRGPDKTNDENLWNDGESMEIIHYPDYPLIWQLDI